MQTAAAECPQDSLPASPWEMPPPAWELCTGVEPEVCPVFQAFCSMRLGVPPGASAGPAEVLGAAAWTPAKPAANAAAEPDAVETGAEFASAKAVAATSETSEPGVRPFGSTPPSRAAASAAEPAVGVAATHLTPGAAAPCLPSAQMAGRTKRKRSPCVSEAEDGGIIDLISDSGDEAAGRKQEQIPADVIFVCEGSQSDAETEPEVELRAAARAAIDDGAGTEGPSGPLSVGRRRRFNRHRARARRLAEGEKDDTRALILYCRCLDICPSDATLVKDVATLAVKAGVGGTAEIARCGGVLLCSRVRAWVERQSREATVVD
jgi:hypothetical protein